MHIFSFQMSYHLSVIFWLSSVPILSFPRANEATCYGWENRGLMSDKFGLKYSLAIPSYVILAKAQDFYKLYFYKPQKGREN